MKEFYIDSDGIKLHAKLVPIHGDDHCFTRHLDEMADAVRDYFREIV